MATYLDLVNKVLQESGAEMDDLSSGTWSSAEAGRRLYPRVKRYVAEAWKMIQMDRNEWEFKAKEGTFYVNPTLKYKFGSRAAGSPVAAYFVGQTSGCRIFVQSVEIMDGTFETDDAEGILQFQLLDDTDPPSVGEQFLEESPGTGEFYFLEKGSYDFSNTDPLLREIHWTTMIAHADDGSSPIQLQFVPWDNWQYSGEGYGGTLPMYYSQDFQGRVVYYPQPLDTFAVNFVYDTGPQTLVAFDDEPVGLVAEYHDWIAWKALGMLARYDKNPDLYSHSATMEAFYMKRAERNILPVVSWGVNKFYE